MKSSSSWLSLDIEIVYHCGYLLSADRGGSPRATQYFDSHRSRHRETLFPFGYVLSFTFSDRAHCML